jgi:hypothetical protein
MLEGCCQEPSRREPRPPSALGTICTGSQRSGADTSVLARVNFARAGSLRRLGGQARAWMVLTRRGAAVCRHGVARTPHRLMSVVGGAYWNP